ncbi:MAG: 6-bladed beta-propeller [Marinilabiliales bacterium]|nr:6-bladed beta-propeller [Marinilabiliales bacterium]
MNVGDFRLRALAISAIPILLSFPACSKRAATPGWEAETEVVDGVRTIRNPETPRYGSFAFDLVKDLAIGEEKDDRYFLPGWVFIDIDSAGTIYACDSGNRRVQVFDRSGGFVRTLGRQGQGPGEYSFPSAVYLDQAGDACIGTGRSLVVFDRDGVFKKNIPVKTFLSTMILGPGGTIIGTTQPNIRAEGGPKNTLVQLGPDGERQRTLAVFPAYGASPGQMLLHWYSGQIAFCARPGDSLYYAFSLDYLIHVVDGEGREFLAFSKAEKSQGISGEEADLTREAGIWAWFGAGDPKTAPLGHARPQAVLPRLLSDDLGRLYVIRFLPITEKAVTSSEVDVFSKDGIYLYRMTWPFLPQVIRGGFLYEVRQDEEAGLTKIIRYRIANWKDFRLE